MNDALSPRQEAFCVAYLRLGSAAAAARRAGYSPAAAKSQGWRLLREPRIRARVDALRRQAGTPVGANANGAVDLAALMAKLESVYDDARERRDFTAAVRAVEAQARLLERFGTLAAGSETPPEAPDDCLDGDPPEDHGDTPAPPAASNPEDDAHRDGQLNPARMADSITQQGADRNETADVADGTRELAPLDLLDHPPGHMESAADAPDKPICDALAGADRVCEAGQHRRVPRVAFDRATVDFYRPRLGAKLRRIAAGMQAQVVEKWERKLELLTLRTALC